jgi:trk system potassium uptake protein TrkA
MEVIELRLKEDSVLDGVRLCDIRQKFKSQVLICCVQRNDEVYIPDGNFVLRGGDRIGITGQRDELQKFFRSTGLFLRQVKNAMILGGSRISHYLAEMLIGEGISVKIIDKDEKVCALLGDALPKSVVICGDGAHQEMLLEEGIRNTDAFISLTGLDETNILVSMFAMMHKVPKVIAKVNRDEIAPMAENLGLGCIISAKHIVSDRILSYARALQNSVGSNVETLYKLMDDKAEALEFNVRGNTKITGVPLKDLRLRKNILIIGIIRDRRVITPSGMTEILDGDKVVIISKDHGARDLSDIFDD